MANGILHCGQVDLALAATDATHAVSLAEAQALVQAQSLNFCDHNGASSQIDDMTPTGFSAASVVRLTSDVAVDLTGMSGGFTLSRVIAIMNVGSYSITIKHSSASSLAANRFKLVDATDFVLKADGVAFFIYDPTGTSWLKVS